MDSVTFTPIGAGTDIGANCYLLSCDGHQILLDCGIHPKKEGKEGLPDFSLLQRAPEAVIISHGHIDHCGAVPYLLKRFPSSVCYATQPTVSIMDRMLHNSVSVMNTLALERGIRDYPLYTHPDVDLAIRRIYDMELDSEFALTRKSPVRAQFRHAGHVLGSASVLVRLPGHTVYYTGDICTIDQELVTGLTPLDSSIEVDTLVIESTRAAHVEDYPSSREEGIDRFAQETGAVLRDGGAVLVPAFALGRSQELLNIICRLQRMGRLPEVPVYTSGLGRAIYEVYSRYPDHLRPDATLQPLYQFDRIGDVWERKVARQLIRKPCIIVATSGMMIESTPSAMIAMEMVRHKRHGIFFVGYLDPDTLGYKLLHAKKGDELCFEVSSPPVKVKLENIQQFHFSAHAPREDLLAIIASIKPRHVVFIHGDPEAIEWMWANCNGAYRKFTPSIGQTVALEG